MSTLQRARAERSMIEQKNGLDPMVSFGEPLGSSDIRGQILVTRKLAG